MAWADVARARVESVLEMTELPGTYQSQRAVEVAMIAARRLTYDAGGGAAEGRVGSRRVRDGRAARRSTSPHIRQRWLREAAKGYTIERLATVRTQDRAPRRALAAATCPTTFTRARTAASDPAR